ncbi:MAG: restriction endonuclease subunit S [Lutibacter sp.]|jgi:hypothetical protein
MTKLVPVSKLFDVVYGINLELVNLTQCKSTDKNAIPFVSRTENNNGVSAFVEFELDIDPNPPHTLSVAGGGSVLSTFYQPLPYYSGRDLYVLIPKKEMSIIEMLFYAGCIRANKYKFNYGRQANKSLKYILIPESISPRLNESLTSSYTSLINSISANSRINKKLGLENNKWKKFELKKLFTITGSKTTPLLELEEYGAGKYPYVTTQATNNGIEGFYNFYSEDGNIITADSAVLGYCSYQPLPFSASDHVEKLVPKFKMNRYIAMFLITILNLEQYRYNYGRKCSQTRMKEMSVLLPEKNGEPDFNFMERYIQSLPYSNSI